MKKEDNDDKREKEAAEKDVSNPPPLKNMYSPPFAPFRRGQDSSP